MVIEIVPMAVMSKTVLSPKARSIQTLEDSSAALISLYVTVGGASTFLESATVALTVPTDLMKGTAQGWEVKTISVNRTSTGVTEDDALTFQGDVMVMLTALTALTSKVAGRQMIISVNHTSTDVTADDALMLKGCVMVVLTVLIAVMNKAARKKHAGRGSLGAEMAFASRWKGAAMATMTARIGLMNLIVLGSASPKNSGATTARASLNEFAAMGGEIVLMDRMRASVLPVAGPIRFGAVEAAV